MRSSLVASALVLSLAFAVAAAAQNATAPPTSDAPLSFRVLVDQISALYPVIKTDVVEISGDRITLAAGRADGVQPGVELATFREGRELYHPTTKKLLGRTEEPLGRVVIKEVFENYSIAAPLEGKLPQPGDQARVSAGKVVLTIVPLSSGVSARITDAATQELIQELDRTQRFRIVIGEQVAANLAQDKISAADFMSGRGVREAQQRAKAPNLLALHFTAIQSKPWV